MAEHKHGTMDIQEHEKTYHGFIKALVYAVAIVIAVLIFLAIFNS
ncbi:MAG: aa3-type cytochrome c oxidase subunit IV [Alphaproteobacteria bacterium]|nr:MAG: aa3-type cytochrome c oxidase subunit IV [Alphaproteobacteria bacterium]